MREMGPVDTMLTANEPGVATNPGASLELRDVVGGYGPLRIPGKSFHLPIKSVGSRDGTCDGAPIIIGTVSGSCGACFASLPPSSGP